MPRKSVLALLLLACLSLPASAPARDRVGYATVGPMLHWNFGDHAFQGFSVGLEAAWWSFGAEATTFGGALPDGKTGFGLDLGFDVDRRGVRIYSEPQIGWVWAGASLGPVLELPWSGGLPRLGIQGSGWFNALVGFDFRLRRIGGKSFQSPGTYAKLPWKISGGAEAPEE